MEELSPHSREVAKGSFWSLAGSAFFKLFSFFYVILLARMASQEDVGLFYLALGIVSVISIFSDLGVSGAIVRYVPYFEGKGERGKIRDIVRLAYAVLSISAVAIMALLFWQADYLGALYHNPSLPPVVRLLSAFILFNNLLRLNMYYLQGVRDIRGSQMYNNIQNGLKLAFTATLFFLFGASAAMIASAFILSFVVAVALSSASIWPSVSKLGARAEKLSASDMGGIVSIGVMIAVIQSFSVVISSLDRVILGYLSDPLHSEATVAVYSIATAFAGVIMMLPVAVGTVFLPLVSRLAGKDDMAGIRSVLATAQRWSMFMTIPAAVVMMLFAAESLGIFYGESYAGGATAMALFTFGLVVYSLSYMIFLALTAMRLVKIELYITVLSGVINTALVVALIPAFGMEGAALAGTIGFAASTLLAGHYGGKLFGFRFPPEIYKMLAAGVATFGLMLLAKPPLYAFLSGMLGAPASGDYVAKASYLLVVAALMALSVAIFVSFALVLRCFRQEDVALMRSVMRKAMVPPQIIGFAEKLASRGIPG